jgi:hypothetical protein
MFRITHNTIRSKLQNKHAYTTWPRKKKKDIQSEHLRIAGTTCDIVKGLKIHTTAC